MIPVKDIKKELEEEFRELRRACFLSGKCKRKHKDKRFRDAPRIAANDLDISGQAITYFLNGSFMMSIG